MFVASWFCCLGDSKHKASSSEGEGVVATPPLTFPRQIFVQLKVAKRLCVIYTNPLTHLFTKLIEIWGYRMGRGESSKLSVEGRGWNSMILILPIIKIFDKIYASNLECRFELAFSYLFCRNQFLPILCVYFQDGQNFEVALTLWRHSDVIRRLMELICLSMEREAS